MSDTVREHYLDWLRDAHAMEKHKESILIFLAERLNHYVALNKKVDEHIQQTRLHQTALSECIARLGESTSTIKDVTAKLTAFTQSVSSMFASDEVIKNTLALYVLENMAIASYKIILACAESLKDTQTKNVCENLLAHEIVMADWLFETVPQITEAFLLRTNVPGLQAKR